MYCCDSLWRLVEHRNFFSSLPCSCCSLRGLPSHHAHYRTRNLKTPPRCLVHLERVSRGNAYSPIVRGEWWQGLTCGVICCAFRLCCVRGCCLRSSVVKNSVCIRSRCCSWACCLVSRPCFSTTSRFLLRLRNSRFLREPLAVAIVSRHIRHPLARNPRQPLLPPNQSHHSRYYRLRVRLLLAFPLRRVEQLCVRFKSKTRGLFQTRQAVLSGFAPLCMEFGASAG